MLPDVRRRARARRYIAAGEERFPDPSPVGPAGTLVTSLATNLYDKFGLVSNDDRRRSRLAGEAVRRGAVSPAGG